MLSEAVDGPIQRQTDRSCLAHRIIWSPAAADSPRTVLAVAATKTICGRSLPGLLMQHSTTIAQDFLTNAWNESTCIDTVLRH